MSTAKQLIPALVEAEPLTWDRNYSKNMRPIRGYPNYWRIIDDVDYIDGPPNIQMTPTRENVVWEARIVKDENLNKTNQIEVRKVSGNFETSANLVNGETIYNFSYTQPEVSFTYTHTAVIDAVAIEFDQNGQRLLVFESEGNIYLNWFDPVPAAVTTTNLGPGRTPVATTSSYKRDKDSSESERFIFYVDANTDDVVVRRQNDRYETPITLPTSAFTVVELLQVSKNYYGALVAVFCYENSQGALVPGVAVSRDDRGTNTVAIGTDFYQEPTAYPTASNAALNEFILRLAAFTVPASTTPDSPDGGLAASVSSGTLNTFIVETKEVILTVAPTADTSGESSISTGALNTFLIENKAITAEVSQTADSPTGDATASTGTLITFDIREAVITTNQDEAVTPQASVSNGILNTFTVV